MLQRRGSDFHDTPKYPCAHDGQTPSGARPGCNEFSFSAPRHNPPPMLRTTGSNEVGGVTSPVGITSFLSHQPRSGSQLLSRSANPSLSSPTNHPHPLAPSLCTSGPRCNLLLLGNMGTTCAQHATMWNEVVEGVGEAGIVYTHPRHYLAQ